MLVMAIIPLELVAGGGEIVPEVEKKRRRQKCCSTVFYRRLHRSHSVIFDVFAVAQDMTVLLL